MSPQNFPDPPENLPEIDREVFECIAHGIEQIPYEAALVANWSIETFHTIVRLIEQRQRCLDMTNDRLQSACMTTWTAQVLFEAARLRRDLTVLTDEETARIFEEHFLRCFDVDPDFVPPEYFNNIL